MEAGFSQIQSHIMFIKLCIWNAFLGEVLLCEQETQIKAVVFIRGWHL